MLPKLLEQRKILQDALACINRIEIAEQDCNNHHITKREELHIKFEAGNEYVEIVRNLKKHSLNLSELL